MMRRLWLLAARALAADGEQARGTVNAALQAHTATRSAAPADSATPATPAAGYGSAGLGPVPLFFLAGSVFAVSAGYGALMPLLPAWLSQLPGSAAAQGRTAPGGSGRSATRDSSVPPGSASVVLTAAPGWLDVAHKTPEPERRAPH